MHESLEKFKPYVEQGLLREVISPCEKLVLWNYSDKCTYEKAWDEVTLNARGTVYEIETGEVIARAFPKFFNYSELEGIDKAKQQEVLNSTDFEVYEKMDGSLGIVYYYDGEWRVNTRGSFTSEQAVKAKEMLDRYNMSYFPTDVTLLVEIIYPENKIIVDYGDSERLVALGAFDLEHGSKDLDDDLHMYLKGSEIPLCRRNKFNSIQDLMNHLKTLDHTEEGYVVRLFDGYRVKFKSAEYLALARIMSNMSPLTFWEKMQDGKIDRAFLEQLPEEFRDECDKIADTLERQYYKIQAEVVGDFERTLKAVNLEPMHPDYYDNRMKKNIGLYLKNNEVEHSSAVFPYVLGKDEVVEKYIKEQIRPTGNVIKE